MKGGPLLLLTTWGRPCVEKILSNFGMIQAADVVPTMSISANREYASITTSKYSPEGRGPQKSMWTVCQGSGGKGDIWRRSGRLLGSFSWHAMHLSIIFLTTSSIPGKQIFSQHSCLVFTKPWWPSWSCAIEISLSRSAAGTIMQLSRRMMYVELLTVSSCWTCLNRFSSV